MTNRKTRKLVIFSIFVVLLCSWAVGNLINLEGDVDTESVFEGGIGERTLLLLPLVLISFPIIYSFYLLYDKDTTSMLTGLILLGFWILFQLAAILLFVYPAAVLSIRGDFKLPPSPKFPSLHFLPDLGFLLLILLSGSILIYGLYLKMFSSEEENQEKHSLEPLNEVKMDREMYEEEMEESLSSTLNKAIDDLHEGEAVRSTIIRCYREMSRILEVSGAKNDDFKTPREFKDEAVKKIPVQEKIISNITYLFEEARYSPHTLGEDKRDRALQHLKKLKEGLL
ncbi:MAG: DUF4129 domain-containing protein [Candidatus Thermoplasmatota archaeon]